MATINSIRPLLRATHDATLSHTPSHVLSFQCMAAKMVATATTRWDALAPIAPCDVQKHALAVVATVLAKHSGLLSGVASRSKKHIALQIIMSHMGFGYLEHV